MADTFTLCLIKVTDLIHDMVWTWVHDSVWFICWHCSPWLWTTTWGSSMLYQPLIPNTLHILHTAVVIILCILYLLMPSTHLWIHRWTSLLRIVWCTILLSWELEIYKVLNISLLWHRGCDIIRNIPGWTLHHRVWILKVFMSLVLHILRSLNCGAEIVGIVPDLLRGDATGSTDVGGEQGSTTSCRIFMIC